MSRSLNHLRQCSTVMSSRYVLASLLCSMAGFFVGVDTSIIGPATVMDGFIESFGNIEPALHGFVVSSLLLAAAFSSFFAGPPADKFGRIPAIAMGCTIYLVGAVLQASAVHIAMFAVGRLIEGFGYGLFFGTLTIYICEIAPPKHRGPLTALPQCLVCIGLVAGYFICYGTVNIPTSLSWRLPFIILSALTAVYIILILCLLPPSPRWLIERGRNYEADKIWDALDVDHVDRRSVEDEIRSDSTACATGVVSNTTQPAPAITWRDLFAKGARDKTLLAIFLMGFMQLCGIDAVLYYAPLLFQQAGLDSAEASFLASGISGIVIVVTTIPAILLADRWGRRTSTIAGGLGLTTVILLMAALYASDATSKRAAQYVVIVCIYLMCVFYATTWAISIKVYAPEIQSQSTRAGATSIAYGFCCATNWFVTFIAPIMIAKSPSAVYWLFGASTALVTVGSFVFMVETKGRTFEEIERAFLSEGQRRKDLPKKMAHACAAMWPFKSAL